MLSDEQIKKFQMLYKTRFGKDLSKEDALEKGIKLIRLIELIYRPMTATEYKELQERRQEIIYITNNPTKNEIARKKI